MSVLGGMVFLASLVFLDITTHGYFLAVEHNPIILGVEISMVGYAVVYLSYQFSKFLKWIREG